MKKEKLKRKKKDKEEINAVPNVRKKGIKREERWEGKWFTASKKKAKRKEKERGRVKEELTGKKKKRRVGRFTPAILLGCLSMIKAFLRMRQRAGKRTPESALTSDPKRP